MSHKKPHLPTKLCATCGRPFTWRKRWAACWESVRYCSDACRLGRRGRRGVSRPPSSSAPCDKA